MPWWSGAVSNYIEEVEPTYVTLKVRAVNGAKLANWTHHSVDTVYHADWLTVDFWKDDPQFTLFVFCPFNTKEGGFTSGNGTMRFPDFYNGECSPDGRLCSFMSRTGMSLYRASSDYEAYFKGNLHVLCPNNCLKVTLTGQPARKTMDQLSLSKETQIPGPVKRESSQIISRTPSPN